MAIHILKEQFEDRRDEWALIVKKALLYLKSLGFKKPSLQIWKFDLRFELADEETDMATQVKSFQSKTLTKNAREELLCTWAVVLAKNTSGLITGQQL